MSFKDISYLELWRAFCSGERNHLCNFGRGHFEEQFYEFISNLCLWFGRCLLKDCLSGALAALVFSGGEPFTGHHGEHSCVQSYMKGALSWYGKLTWESAHAWNLIILC